MLNEITEVLRESHAMACRDTNNGSKVDSNWRKPQENNRRYIYYIYAINIAFRRLFLCTFIIPL
jgi:hypothetical protein